MASSFSFMLLTFLGDLVPFPLVVNLCLAMFLLPLCPPLRFVKFSGQIKLCASLVLQCSLHHSGHQEYLLSCPINHLAALAGYLV